MKELKLKANAKINLSLDVQGKREDGYHLLSMVMQSIELADNITLKINETGEIQIYSNISYLPTGRKNIAYKAAEIFLEEIKSVDGVEIYIEKHIPMGGGMAGGSTDAAGVLVGLNKLYNKPLPVSKLLELGLSLGADVPFCILGGTRFVQGIGEKLEKLDFANLTLLIIKPKKSISTKEAFGKLDLNNIQNRPDNIKLMEGIKENNKSKIYESMDNSLYQRGLELVPEMQNIIEKLELGFKCKKAMMTGSGSTVFGIFEDNESLQIAYKYFKFRYKNTFITKTAEKSIIIQE